MSSKNRIRPEPKSSVKESAGVTSKECAQLVQTDRSNDTLKTEEELKLAKLLAKLEEGGSNEIGCELAPKQQDEFNKALSALELLNMTSPTDTGGLSPLPLDAPNNDDWSMFEVPQPDRIGNFEVVSELGRGGFGIVFLARDETLNRNVAIKVPKLESYLTEESRVRFAREARAAALLTHPAIVPVYESGMCGPIPYIATALCKGETLAAWFDHRDKTIDFKLAARIVSRLADAMQHAHSRGIIHRDLKPANILVDLETSDEVNAVQLVDSLRITDFGLARSHVDNGLSINGPLTTEGAIIGTPEYMSPEQVNSLPCSPATDIYSLGVILYELMTGAPPFQRKKRFKTLQAIQSEEPRPPKSLNKAIPVDLQAICLKCLEKSPTNRYQDAHSLAEDLNNLLSSKPVKARPISPLSRVFRWCQRQPIVAFLLATLFLVSSAGFATVFFQWRVSQTNLGEALRQKERSNLFLAQSENAIDQMLNRAASSMSDIPSLTTIRKELLQDALELQTAILDQESENQTTSARTVAAHARLARIQIELGLFGEAKTNCDEAVKLYDSMMEKDPALEYTMVSLLNSLAGLQLTRHDPDAALATVERAFRLLQTIDEGTSNPKLTLLHGRFLLRQAGAFNLKNEPQQAIQVYQLANDYLDAISSEIDKFDSKGNVSLLVVKIDALIGSAGIHKQLGELELAKSKLAEAIEIATSDDPANESERSLRRKLAESYAYLGGVHIVEYNNEQSASSYRNAVRILEDLTQRNPLVFEYQRLLGNALGGLSVSQRRMKQFSDAIDTLNRSIEVQDRCLEMARDVPNLQKVLATTHSSLANAISELDLAGTDAESRPTFGLSQAIRNWETAEKIHQSLIQQYPNDPNYFYRSSLGLGKWAKAYLRRGEFAKAEAKLEVAIAHGRRAVDSNFRNPSFANNYINLLHRQTLAKCGLGKHEIAFEIIEEIKLKIETAKHCLDSASDLAKCVDKLSDANSDTHQQYIDACFWFLNQAVELDETSIGRIGKSHGFGSLREDVRFNW